MEKPVSIVCKELEEKIVSAINEASLPAFIILPIVRDVLRKLEILESEQYKKDVEDWGKAQSNLRAGDEKDGKQTNN